ncbi:MAG: glycoside hydrolase family 9 protein [Planctomycetota bacterium]
MRIASLVMASMLIGALPASRLSAQSLDPHLRVDQLGYTPLAAKVAILREPVIGHDAPAPYTPGSRLEVRRVADGSVAWSGTATPWNGGAVHAQSGDRVWWVDFSALTEVGSFALVDVDRGRSSAEFRIAEDVFAPALRAAQRMFYYQRCGTPKATPHAEPAWSDGVCHLGAEQDIDCRSVLDPSPGSTRDLRGGWHDAGDYNKYTNFADDPVHALLSAYRANPAYWPDDLGIPESGNGTPDLLDAIRWEIDWLLRMQEPDGSVLHKVSVVDFDAASPPSADTAPRRYGPPTASATVSACGVFAHAAVVFAARSEPTSQAFAATLEAAALAAWDWLERNPTLIPSSYDNAGFQSADAEDPPYEQDMNRLRAAVWLYALTGDAVYQAWVDGNWTSSHLSQWTWASPYELGLHEAMLAYGDLPGATAAVADAIRGLFAASVTGGAHLAEVTSSTDAYRAPLADQDYVWGSNGVKSSRALLFVLLNRYGLEPQSADVATAAAEGYLHYLHGVNPPGIAFITQLDEAEGSATETYHAWFDDGTIWDSSITSLYGPAPGYVTGGANPNYVPDPAYSGPPLEPPLNQPIQKSYRDWNTSWPENSWEITECSLGYQAPYLALLAAHTLAPAPRLGLQVDALSSGASAQWSIVGGQPGDLAAVLWAVAPGRIAVRFPGWALDLGLAAPPLGGVLFAGVLDPTGSLGATLRRVPPTLSGSALWFQATQADDIAPVQSAPLVRVVR